MFLTSSTFAQRPWTWSFFFFFWRIGVAEICLLSWNRGAKWSGDWDVHSNWNTSNFDTPHSYGFWCVCLAWGHFICCSRRFCITGFGKLTGSFGWNLNLISFLLKMRVVFKKLLNQITWSSSGRQKTLGLLQIRSAILRVV